MANINDAFPSSYLKAADLQGSTPTVTIANVKFEEVGKDRDLRPIVYFAGKEKGVVLNKTNANNISKLYGPETDDWIGKPVMLGTAMVDFNGQSVESIRIYPPKQAKQSVAKPAPRPTVSEELDDEIPF